MRILLHGNSPHVKSGYGVQIAMLADRLAELGHDVAVSSTYGQQGGSGVWSTTHGKPVVCYPHGFDPNGNDSIHLHAAHHFGGDELGGWIITLLDVWALTTPMLRNHNVAAWVPVDHFPAPKDVLSFFERSDAVPVVMSKYGERQLRDAGLDPVYVPLAVDTTMMRPTATLEVNGQTMTGRELLDIESDAFVVGMVAMNKGWARDRKGFNEALRAFGVFWTRHPEAVLYLHAEKFGGAEGINLVELAAHAAVPVHAIRYVDQYAYRLGVPAEMMAATYTAMDVLLAPSHGEGFCVPLIEAQACGVPVIATDFSAQPELVGAGWTVAGQLEWDPAQHASYVCPFTADVLDKLELAYEAAQDPVLRQRTRDDAIAFAANYDADKVFEQHWRPFLATLEPAPEPAAKPIMDDVAVIVPAMREANLARLRDSFEATNDGTATLIIVGDRDSEKWADLVTGQETTTFAEKVNRGFDATTQSFVLLVGDDVEFKPGWIEAARSVSEHADVIGTNDTDNGVRNTDVAAGRHADHFFVRRSYVTDEGSSLEGPGVLAPTCYRHWFVDREMVSLAKARGVFTPCLDSVVVHHHPGYVGDEKARESDPVYMTAVEHADADAKTFKSRLPLIEQHRASRAKR